MLSTIGYFAFESFSVLSDDVTITTAPIWNDAVDWVTKTFFEPLLTFRSVTFNYYFKPLRTVITALPWTAAVLAVGTIGWILGKWRYAIVASLYVAFIAFSGFWPQSTETFYLVIASLILCITIGVPLGIWAAEKT